jgi:MFS family permease
VLLIAAFCAGFCISGGQKSVIALAAIFYPAPIRSTGVGWALGIGRLGSIGGPLLIGVLLAYQLSAASLFYGRPSRCCWPAFWSCCWASNTRRRERAAAAVQFFDAVSGDLHRRAMGGIIPKNLRAARLICTLSSPRAAAQSAPYLAQFRTMRAWPAICRSNGCCRRKFLQGLPPRIEAARARKEGCDGTRRASII